MSRAVYLASRSGSVVCPACGIEKLSSGEGGEPRCERCGLSWSADVVGALERIASLPDASGGHPCEECHHPEMRLLPDGVFHCPACRSEVLPVPEAGSGDDAYRSGWAHGLFGKTESLAKNGELARWEDPLDRLRFYQGCRAGREAIGPGFAGPGG